MSDPINESSDTDSLTFYHRFLGSANAYGDLLRAAAGDLSPAPVPRTPEQRRKDDAARVANVGANQAVAPNTRTMTHQHLALKPLQLQPGLRTVAAASGSVQPAIAANTFIPTGHNKAAEQAHAFSMIGVNPADLRG